MLFIGAWLAGDDGGSSGMEASGCVDIATGKESPVHSSIRVTRKEQHENSGSPRQTRIAFLQHLQ
jgi:hypothetical protein